MKAGAVGFLGLILMWGVAALPDASVYSRHFTGHKTASGQPYDPNRKTVASRDIPLNTCVEVTNDLNHKKTYALVNDRGPWVLSRQYDLSSATAKALGISTLGQVTAIPVKRTLCR